MTLYAVENVTVQLYVQLQCTRFDLPAISEISIIIAELSVFCMQVSCLHVYTQTISSSKGYLKYGMLVKPKMFTEVKL